MKEKPTITREEAIAQMKAFFDAPGIRGKLKAAAEMAINDMEAMEKDHMAQTRMTLDA